MENTEVELFVPGRLCVLGEHSDWAGEYRDVNPSVGFGMTLVCATNEGLYSRCCKLEGSILRFEHIDPKTNSSARFESRLDAAELKAKAAEGGFYQYIAGTAAAVLDYMHSVSHPFPEYGLGINNYKTTLPMQKGLSSSAAICVMIAKAFNEIFGLQLTTKLVMELAYKGEMFTPSRCGRMDQCVALGAGFIGLMEFNMDFCHVRIISNKTPLYFVVADLNSSKDTVCILRSLNDCFPVPSESNQSRMHRYVTNNQKLAWNAIAAIEKGDTQRLANAMIDAQQMFDDCAIDNCPSELTSPRLHEIISNPSLKAISLAAKGVGSQGDGTVQVLCSGPDEQMKVLSLLETEFKCSGFVLTVPATLPHPERSLPLFHPHRVRCALIISDPFAYARYPFLASYCPPCLLPIPFQHGTKSALLSLLLDLIACGIQRIAVVVPCPRGSSVSTSLDEAAADVEFLKDVYQKSLNPGLSGSSAGLAGNSHGTRGSFQLNEEGETERAPNRGAFKKRGSFTKVSSNWSYNKELFEIINGRTRFFFDTPERQSYYPLLHSVVNALHGTVGKLAGPDSPGQLLVLRAESQLEATYRSPRAPKGHEISLKPKSLGLYGFLKDSIDTSAGISSEKPSQGNTAPPTPTGNNKQISSQYERLSPMLALSAPLNMLESTSDLSEVILQVDTIINPMRQSHVANSKTYLSIVEPEVLTQFQKLGGNRQRSLEAVPTEVGSRQYRKFEGIGLIPYDLLLRSLSMRAGDAGSGDMTSPKHSSNKSGSKVGPMSSRRTGQYMHPVDVIMADLLDDTFNPHMRISSGADGETVMQATMVSKQDVAVKSNLHSSPGNTSSKVHPIASNLTLSTSTNPPHRTIEAQESARRAPGNHESSVECVGIEISCRSFHTLSDFGYRNWLSQCN